MKRRHPLGINHKPTNLKAAKSLPQSVGQPFLCGDRNRKDKMMEKLICSNTRRLNAAWIVITGICAIATLIISAVSLTYQMSGVDQAYRWQATFAPNQNVAVIGTARHWDKGNLYYGVNQTTGVVKTKYDIWWKKANGSYNLEFANGYCNANGAYYGEWYMHSPNGISQYTYKLLKKTNQDAKSILIVDFLLT